MSSVDNEPVYLLKSIALNLGGHFTVKIEGDNFVFTSTKSGTDYIKSKVEVSNAIAKDDVEWFDIDRQNFIEEFSEELRPLDSTTIRMMSNPSCNINSSNVVKLIEIMTPFIDMMYASKIVHSTIDKGIKRTINVFNYKKKCNATNYTDISTSLANFLSVVYRCFNGLNPVLHLFTFQTPTFI